MARDYTKYLDLSSLEETEKKAVEPDRKVKQPDKKALKPALDKIEEEISKLKKGDSSLKKHAVHLSKGTCPAIKKFQEIAKAESITKKDLEKLVSLAQQDFSAAVSNQFKKWIEEIYPLSNNNFQQKRYY